ncbi:MAG: O-antigen translocase [Phycisphaerae bacterium]|nr:O-antigen translocase [Phycisphaerae bacterium]
MSTVTATRTDISMEGQAIASPKAISKGNAASGSYRSILKSTSLIGGASVANILIGMVRTKFVAILLGPSGVGLMGMYTQVVTLITTISGMGLSQSGVRQVAEAVGTGNDERVARTVLTLRRTVWLTGILGLSAMLIFCVPISRISFGNSEHALAIALLGGTILLAAITSGQACVLRGTRRIADLAKISVIGAINGTIISIPCFYFWGQRGIVVSLIVCAVASLGTSWWFARRVHIKRIALSWHGSTEEARRLLTLGLAFMGAGVVTALSEYLIRVLLLREFSLQEVGIYQAAFGLSGVLVGFVLTAMSTDYYPRLTAIAEDDAMVSQMVNEQSEVSLLLALPPLAAMMVFAPLIIRVFYAGSFVAAIPVLRWCLLGVLGRVISWPLGFVIMAKGRGRLFFITVMMAAAAHVIAVYCFTSVWGLAGTGIAFMALYVVYTVFVLGLMHHLVGATWTPHTVTLVVLSMAVMAALMLICNLGTSPAVYWGISLTVLGVITYCCTMQLSHKSGISWNSLLVRLGAVTPAK